MLRIAVSAKAIFDMTEACNVYRASGAAAFENFMTSKIDEPLKPGPFFPHIKALQATGLVEISLISKIGPIPGERIRRSLERYGINIPNQYYADGHGAYQKAKDLHAYFNCDDVDAKDALSQNNPLDKIPIISLSPNATFSQESLSEIKIGLDFDGVIASDVDEIVFRTDCNKDVKKYNDYQQHPNNINAPLTRGPYTPLVVALSELRQTLKQYPNRPQLILAMFTARGEEAKPRALATLKHFNIELDEYHFLDGKPKGEAVKAFGSHLFIDDNRGHCDNVAKAGVLAGHAPDGIANKDFAPTRAPKLFLGPNQHIAPPSIVINPPTVTSTPNPFK